MTHPIGLSLAQLKEVFDSWRKQAMEDEKAALLWNALWGDIRQKFEPPHPSPQRETSETEHDPVVYRCEDCDFNTDDASHAQDHEMETGHVVTASADGAAHHSRH